MPEQFDNMKTITNHGNAIELGVSEQRPEAPQGPERRLVAQAAERAERQGGVEDLREGRRVAPVTA